MQDIRVTMLNKYKYIVCIATPQLTSEIWMTKIGFDLANNRYVNKFNLTSDRVLFTLISEWDGGGGVNQPTFFKLVKTTEKVNFWRTIFIAKFRNLHWCLRDWSSLDHTLKHPWKLLVWAVKNFVEKVDIVSPPSSQN